MIYHYNSFLEPYVSMFLEQQKPSVCSFSYAHYCGILQHFDQHVIEMGYSDCNFTEEQVYRWINTIEGKESTVVSYVSCIKSFFTFLGGYGFHPFLPSSPKVPDDYMAYEYTDKEVDLFISIADNYVLCSHPNQINCPHPKGKYWNIQFELPMVLRILFGCGLRLEEASTLQLRDIDFQDDTLIICKTKSREYRIVPMDPSLATILSQYCTAMGLGANPDAYIFPGTDFSAPIPSYCFRNHFKRVLAKAGISLPGRKKHERGPCIHCLRHAFAHRSFMKGTREGWAINDQIPWLSVYMGHRDLRETEKYLKFNSEVFSDAIDPFESYSTDLFPEVNFDE